MKYSKSCVRRDFLLKIDTLRVKGLRKNIILFFQEGGFSPAAPPTQLRLRVRSFTLYRKGPGKNLWRQYTLEYIYKKAYITFSQGLDPLTLRKDLFLNECNFFFNWTLCFFCKFVPKNVNSRNILKDDR